MGPRTSKENMKKKLSDQGKVDMPYCTPEGESLSGARMFEMNDANAAEEVVWCGRWAKQGEAVLVKLSLQGNTTKFRESDVQQSLHAVSRRKNLPEELIDATLRNAEVATGPWQQTMAAAAAMELANNGWLTKFFIEENVNPVDFEVFVLDHTGQSQHYARADGVTHEQLLERRKEQDTRKIVLYLTWPPQFKSFQPEELKVAS